MGSTLFYIIIAIIVFDFILERVLQYLNITWRSKPIPEELNGIYDKEKYAKQQAYSKENSRFSSLTSAFSFVLILVFLFFQGFAILNNYLSQSIENELLLGLAFFGILFIANDIIAIPFSIYDTFVIEQKYGFNKMTAKTFVLDKFKGYLLTAVIGGVLYAIIYLVYIYTGKDFWIYCWGILSFFMIFFSMFYSNIIVPLFNKQKPLSNLELKKIISEFSTKVGFKVDNIYEIDGSKRSSRANAYFTGLGPKKRIVLYDTLLNELSDNEVLAVLAHEIGHYKKKHTLVGILISLIQTGIMLFILSLLITNPLLSQALGVKEPTFHIALIAFALLYSPISTVTGLFMNILSRKNEYEADNFVRVNADEKELIAALKQLSKNNLSNLTPHPLFVWVNYSHPTILQRIKMLKK